ncbi:hypothetical protein AAG570_004714 [Ranatra chinensis]|uniref:C2H2-type domain-containing protein n=1 Tax=Ranatra chinensis TaxID=642074 RepID=A0ABD0YG95_9HEMI
MGFKSGHQEYSGVEEAEDAPLEVGRRPDKQYFCFMCDRKSGERGLPLLGCRTTFSNICLGEKLQEILGDRRTLLVSTRDAVCWTCATCINRIDRYEYKRDILKEYIMDNILAKYRHHVPIPREVLGLENDNQKEESETKDAEPQPKPEPKPTKVEPVSATSAPQVMQDTSQEHPKAASDASLTLNKPQTGSGKKFVAAKESVKVKRKSEHHLCRFCGYSYTTEPALLTHMLQKHPPKFLCHICDSPFSNKTRYNAHMELHKMEPTSRMFKCRTCGFSSDVSQAEYNHKCDNLRVLTCGTCKKERYVPKEVVVEKEFECDHCRRQPPPPPQQPPQQPPPPPQQPPPPLHPSPQPAPPSTEAELKIGEVEVIAEVTNDIDVPPIEFSQEVAKSDLVMNNDILLSQEQVGQQVLPRPSTLIRCPNCEEEFELAGVANHRCFVENHVVEYLQAYNPEEDDDSTPYTTEIIEIVQEKSAESPVSRLKCKTCDDEFPSTNHLRRHWQTTGHPWEVNTDYVEFNRIVDKVNNTQTTFKVLKQKFDIKTNVVGASAVSEEDDALKNMIVRVNDAAKCAKCDVEFIDEAALREHESGGCLTCITCAVTFLDNKLLRRHYLCTGHSSKIGAKVEYAKTEVVDQTHAPARLHRCRRCKKEFDSAKQWLRHRLRHMVRCGLCRARFTTRRSLRLHNRRFHAGTSCRVCGKRCARAESLHRHEERHPARPLACGRCAAVEASRLALWAHWRVHHALYACPNCDRHFPSTALLAVHRWRHRRAVKPYRCPLCARATFFSTPGTLRRHMAGLHPQARPPPRSSAQSPALTSDEQLLNAAESLISPLLLDQGGPAATAVRQQEVVEECIVLTAVASPPPEPESDQVVIDATEMMDTLM